MFIVEGMGLQEGYYCITTRCWFIQEEGGSILPVLGVASHLLILQTIILLDKLSETKPKTKIKQKVRFREREKDTDVFKEEEGKLYVNQVLDNVMFIASASAGLNYFWTIH